MVFVEGQGDLKEAGSNCLAHKFHPSSDRCGVPMDDASQQVTEPQDLIGDPATSSLSDALMKLSQRETGGIVGSDRYDYQKDWGLCKILELHATGLNYVVLFEFHEDIAVLNDPAQPTRVAFYQVKTDSKKKWTVQRLIARKKGRGGNALPSILGNLCGKSIHLDNYDVEYRFASNAKYRIKSVKGQPLEDEDSFRCVDINDDDRLKLLAALSAELGVKLPDNLEQSLGFEVASLALLGHSDTTRGRLAKFLDEYASGCTVNAAALYRTLFDEIRRRTSAKRPETTFADVCNRKGISRALLDTMLQDAIRFTPADRTWTLIQQELISAGTTLAERLALDQAAKGYFVRRLNPLDASLQRLRSRALAIADQIIKANLDVTLLEVAREVLKALKNSEEQQCAEVSDHDIKALVMVELYERRESEIPALGTKSSKSQL